MTHAFPRSTLAAVVATLLIAPGRADEPPPRAPDVPKAKADETDARKVVAEPSPNVLNPPPLEEFLVVPLRLHVLQATDLPEVDCGLTDADLARILKKVNGIWHKAGIHWGVESIVREPAAQQEKFREARERDGARNLGAYRMLAPEGSRKFDGLHVYYLHKFPVNGVWLGGGQAFVQETAKLRAVEGGIDEPVPRVTAHELGHALGLPHRQDRTNLLASGTTGTLLNAREVETARKTARRRSSTLSLPALEKAAASATDKDQARRLWTWLSEIPGGESKAKANLERLEKADAGTP